MKRDKWLTDATTVVPLWEVIFRFFAVDSPIDNMSCTHMEAR